MFTHIENKVVEILKSALPGGLVPPERIVAGPVEDPAQGPLVAFTAGAFDIIPNDQILDIPQPDSSLSFAVCSLLQVWANTHEQVEEIALKAMAAILVQTPMIEAGSNGELILGNLKLSFSHHQLRPLKGIKVLHNGSMPKGEVTYALDSVMTVTQLDFDVGKMKVIDTVMQKPLPADLQFTALPPILAKDVGTLRGIGTVTRQKLAQHHITTIRQLALADTRILLDEVPVIDGLVQNAKAVRRIGTEILKEIVDREHPFSEDFYQNSLSGIAQLTAAEIHNQTGKSEENALIFLDNLQELNQTLFKSAEFAALRLADFM